MTIPSGECTRIRAIREAVEHFSSGSRRRFLAVVNSLDQRSIEAGEWRFWTGTYGKKFSSARASKRHLDNFIKAFERKFGPRGLFWKLEPQERGAPHYHLMIRMGVASDAQFQAELDWVARTWYRIAGRRDRNHLKWHRGELGNGNKPCWERVSSWKQAIQYAGKYLGKVVGSAGEWKAPGRYWGVRRKSLLPMAVETDPCTLGQAKFVRRMCVRWYAHQPSRQVYIPGKSVGGGSAFVKGRRLDLNSMWGHGSQARKVRDCLPEIAATFGVVPRLVRYHWPSARGGCSMFMPAAEFDRILRLAGVEVRHESGAVACGSRTGVREAEGGG